MWFIVTWLCIVIILTVCNQMMVVCWCSCHFFFANTKSGGIVSYVYSQSHNWRTTVYKWRRIWLSSFISWGLKLKLMSLKWWEMRAREVRQIEGHYVANFYSISKNRFIHPYPLRTKILCHKNLRIEKFTLPTIISICSANHDIKSTRFLLIFHV